LNAKKYGAAFLAQTLVLRSDEVVPNLRRQPLLNAPDVYLLAVTRTETDKKERPNLFNLQKAAIVSFINQTVTLSNPFCFSFNKKRLPPTQLFLPRRAYLRRL